VESGLAEKMGAALPPGSAGVVAIYDRSKANTVDATLVSGEEIGRRGRRRRREESQGRARGSTIWHGWLTGIGQPSAAGMLSVLMVYYSYTQQTLKVVEEMAGVLRARDCDVNLAAIEFLLSYLGSGEYRERYLGVKIPPTNLQGYHLDAAGKFADEMADRLLARAA